MGLNEMEASSSATRKRKPNRVVIYGYDPGIATIPGDPRLEPPPSWFGVNYHKSQPVSNSWQEWYGDRSAMFDIAKNRIVPVSKESQIAKESSKRRKPNNAAESLPLPLPFPFFSMMWHPAQPVRNEWQDWGDNPMVFMPSPAQIQQLQKRMQSKSPAPWPLPLSAGPPVAAPLGAPSNQPLQPARRKPGSGALKPLIPVKPTVNESSTMQALLKEKEDKAKAATARARALAKLNRQRKEWYQKLAENHVEHLEEICQVTAQFLHQLRVQHSRRPLAAGGHRPLDVAEVGSPGAEGSPVLRLTARQTQLLRSGILGNSTALPASHKHCSHPQLALGGAEVEGALKGSKHEGRMGSLLVPLEERRLRYLLSFGVPERLARLRWSLVALYRTVERLSASETANQLLSLAANADEGRGAAEQDAVTRMRAMSLTGSEEQWNAGSPWEQVQQVIIKDEAKDMANELSAHLNLSQEQKQQLAALRRDSTAPISGGGEVARVELMALKKILRNIVHVSIARSMAEDQQLIDSNLNEKQKKKLLKKLAEKNLDETENTFK